MTVQELIDELLKVSDKTLPVKDWTNTQIENVKEVKEEIGDAEYTDFKFIRIT